MSLDYIFGISHGIIIAMIVDFVYYHLSKKVAEG